MSSPLVHPGSAEPRSVALEDDAFCDLCGESIEPHEFSRAAFEASGMNICGACLETMLDASTFNARTTLGLVGGIG